MNSFPILFDHYWTLSAFCRLLPWPGWLEVSLCVRDLSETHSNSCKKLKIYEIACWTKDKNCFDLKILSSLDMNDDSTNGSELWIVWSMKIVSTLKAEGCALPPLSVLNINSLITRHPSDLRSLQFDTSWVYPCIASLYSISWEVLMQRWGQNKSKKLQLAFCIEKDFE